MRRRIAVALHDVEPATFARCALIRDWLSDHAIDRVTLLVIPAADGHPFYQRSPELGRWLRERNAAGDAVAQHGLVHHGLHAGGPFRRWQGGAAAEFAGLTGSEAFERVECGREILTRAGLRPHGFVAPAYAYTPALRRRLRTGFDWWATLLRGCAGNRTQLMPAVGLGASTRLKRAVSPRLAPLVAPFAGETLRLDLHPADFAHPRHVWAIERILVHSASRTAVTYDELLAR